MSRRSRNYKREVMVDPRFGTVQVSKFINAIMMEGKKSVAETIVYNAFDIIEKKASQPPLEVFEEALNKVRPEIEVRSRRVGGATYQVPMDVRQTRAFALAFRWLIAAARNRSEKTFQERLGLEIFEASQGRGAAVKKREDTVKMAEANRAFAHYRW